MPKRQQTPGEAAAAWAAEHPDASAMITVLNWRRNNEHRTQFAAVDGEVRPVRADVYGPGPARSNGHCQHCGRVYLEQVLATYWAPDPQAGARVPDYP